MFEAKTPSQVLKRAQSIGLEEAIVIGSKGGDAGMYFSISEMPISRIVFLIEVLKAIIIDITRKEADLDESEG
jgi:hypothetical protein